MKKISVIGALWTDNFGDILLADLYTRSLIEDKEISLSFPNIGKKVAIELGVSCGTFDDFMKSKSVFFIGGGYLSEPPKNKTKWALSRFKLIFVYGFLARILRKKYYILGVGAGPVKTKLASIIIKIFCNGATKIVVRDQYSFDTLKRIGVNQNISISFDYALKLKESYVHKDSQNMRGIALHLTSKQPILNKFITKYLLESRKYDDIWFIEDHPGEYERVRNNNDDISKLIGDKLIPYSGYLSMLDTIDSFKFVLTSKLHVGILAAIFEKKICSFPYHDKVKQFYKEIGFDNNCFKGTLSETAIIQHFENCYNSGQVLINQRIYDKLNIIDNGIEQIKKEK